MATKTQIKAKIQAMLSQNAGLTTREQHEEFLHTATESILENIYPQPTYESSNSTILTSTGVGADAYYLVFTKTGRRVNINGRIETNNVSGGLLKITNNEFKQDGFPYFGFGGSSGISGNIRVLRLLGNELMFYLGSKDGTSYDINISYNTLD